MILIITHKEDFTVDFVVDKLNQRNVNYYRFNCEDIDESGYNFTINSKHLQFQLANQQQYKSVWFRRTKLPPIDIEDIGSRAFILSEYDALLGNLLETIDCSRWLSRPGTVYRAENKFLQLSIARKIGFKLPNTLVTSDKSQVKKFYEENNANIIIKPLASSRVTHSNGIEHIFTNRVLSKDIEMLKSFDLTPAIFQENIQKKYELRVTVVHDKAFSAYVDSQNEPDTQYDWRKKKLKFHEAQIPEQVELLCIQLVKKLNLSFGAIDLIQTLNDDYIFLEINPNGQWAWIEFDTGLQISEAIINYLENESV